MVVRNTPEKERCFSKEKDIKKSVLINSLTTNAPHDIEISQLICIANQLTGFYMMENIGRQ